MAATKGAILITGCTHGLGYEALQVLSADPSVETVILACRNVAAAKRVASSLPCSAEFEKLVVLEAPCLLTDLAAVRTYASALAAFLRFTGQRLRAVVANAGVGGKPSYATTVQGHEEIFATNHLGHFLLILSLLPLLQEGAVIVNVASEVHDPASGAPLPDPGQHWPRTDAEYEGRLGKGLPLSGETQSESGSRRYSRSKLANVLFTYSLALRLSGDLPAGVLPTSAVGQALSRLPAVRQCSLPCAPTLRVLAFNPGLLLDTAFVSGVAGAVVGWVAYAASPLLRLTPLGRFMRSAPVSGLHLAQLARGEVGCATTAAYYDGLDRKASSEFSLSEAGVVEAGEALWRHSLAWTGVSAEELRAAGLQPPEG